jgi:hypothetical protein
MRSALLLGALTGCFQHTDVHDHGTSIGEARSRWNARSSPIYSFHRQNDCFCSPETTREMLITADGKRLTDAIYTDDQTPVADELRTDLTIDAMFDTIDEAIAQEADRVDVKFHVILGYPTELSVVYDRNVGDAELTLRALDLTVGAR